MDADKKIQELALKLSGGKTLEQLRGSATRKEGEFVGNLEAVREYAQRVHATTKREIKRPPIQHTQQMEYDEAAAKVRALLIKRAGEIATQKNNPNFRIILSPEQGEVIKSLIQWAISDPTGKIPLGKSPWLYGAPGTFKTEIMSILSAFAESNSLTNSFVITNWSIEIDNEIANPGGLIDRNKQFNRCFDEFMRKCAAISYYGNKVNPNEAIIEQRYLRFKKYGQRTLVITNYSPNQVAEESGLSEMALSRIAEMTYSILMPGECKRNF